MPFLDAPEEFNINVPLKVPEQRTPSFNETLDSAFAMENDVANAYELLTRPIYMPEKNFDLGNWLKLNDLWEQRESYIGVRSTAEAEWKRGKIAKEQSDRETLIAAGVPGLIAAMGAGLISPTTLLPLVGPTSKGAAAVKEGIFFSILAAGLQEAPLFINQETRTGKEVAFSLGASAVLGGILGGAVGLLRKGELDRMASDMDGSRGERYGFRLIPNSTEPSSGGAAATEFTASGGLKKGLLGSDKLAFIGPVTRGIAQDESQMVRYITSRFADAGVVTEDAAKGVAPSPGGNVESLIKTYYPRLAGVVQRTDELYGDYLFGNSDRMLFRNTRAVLSGLVTSGKLRKDQFMGEVGRYLFRAEANPIPEVNKAVEYMRKELFDPLFDEAVEVGIFKAADKEEILKIDPAYASRIWIPEKIEAKWNEFVDVFSKHINGKLQAQFGEMFRNYVEQARKSEDLIHDLEVDEEMANSLKAKWMEDLDTLEKASPEHLKLLEDDIEDLRAQRRKIDPGASGGKESRSAIEKEIEELRKFGGEALPKMQKVRAEIKRRLRNLSRARVVLAEKQAAKLERIERLEEMALASMNRAVRSAQKFLREIDKLDDDAFYKQLNKLQRQFKEAGEIYDAGEERLTKLAADDPDIQRVLTQEEIQGRRNEKLSDLAERIGELHDLDRAGFREGIQMGLDEMLEKVAELNMRRGARRARLTEQAKALDPAQVDARLQDIKKKALERGTAFRARTREMGGEDIDVDNGMVDFMKFAREQAEDIGMTLRGIDRRVPFNDILAEKHGVTKARTLDIPTQLVEQFIENDAMRIARIYIRSMASDISMARVFGDANGAEVLERLAEEEKGRLEVILKQVDKDGKPLSKEAIEAEAAKVAKFYNAARNDIYALIERARGIRGAPRDPAGAAERFLRFAQNLNVLRYMGGVTIASIPDAARHIQAYGMKRAYRDGFQALITNLKAVKMNAREGRLAGAGLDPILHSRAHAMADIWDDFAMGSKFERGVEFLTNKMGLVGLFDYWTSGMKAVASHMTVVKMLDSIDLVVNGGPKKAVDEATEFLARSNLTPAHIEEIWKQVTNGTGGGKVNGTWVPQTADWDVADPKVRDALRAFRAALVGHADRIIVTPGFERPLISDASPMMKALFQFKSFGMASTTKTLMAGLQERDARYVQGVLFSLALGMLSYYVWAVSVGGKAQAEMENADFDKWVDEAITRSGQTAIFDELQRIGQRIPGLSPYMSLSNTRSSRREGGDLTEALLGPTFDALEKASGVIVGADDPTQHTLHMLRQLLPFQNLIGLRRIFDAVEDAAGLPETRDEQ